MSSARFGSRDLYALLRIGYSFGIIDLANEYGMGRIARVEFVHSRTTISQRLARREFWITFLSVEYLMWAQRRYPFEEQFCIQDSKIIWMACVDTFLKATSAIDRTYTTSRNADCSRAKIET